jgi:hypothetical protein
MRYYWGRGAGTGDRYHGDWEVDDSHPNSSVCPGKNCAHFCAYRQTRPVAMNCDPIGMKYFSNRHLWQFVSTDRIPCKLLISYALELLISRLGGSIPLTAHHYRRLNLGRTSARARPSGIIKCFLQTLLNEPHSTHRYYGELLGSYQTMLFSKSHSP